MAGGSQGLLSESQAEVELPTSGERGADELEQPAPFAAESSITGEGVGAKGYDLEE